MFNFKLFLRRETIINLLFKVGIVWRSIQVRYSDERGCSNARQGLRDGTQPYRKQEGKQTRITTAGNTVQHTRLPQAIATAFQAPPGTGHRPRAPTSWPRQGTLARHQLDRQSNHRKCYRRPRPPPRPPRSPMASHVRLCVWWMSAGMNNVAKIDDMDSQAHRNSNQRKCSRSVSIYKCRRSKHSCACHINTCCCQQGHKCS